MIWARFLIDSYMCLGVFNAVSKKFPHRPLLVIQYNNSFGLPLIARSLYYQLSNYEPLSCNPLEELRYAVKMPFNSQSTAV